MPRKRSNRRKPAQRPKREFNWPQVNWLMLRDGALAVLLGTCIWSGSVWLLERPINAVRVQGTFQRVTAVQVEAAMAPYLGSGFLTLDIAGLREAVTALPWVQDASIVRSWPATLQVSLVEEQPAARWGKAGLLNVHGELFVTEAKHVPAELPALSGPTGSESQVAERYFALDTQLKQRGLHARELMLDERGSWLLTLSNGMQVRFGAAELDERTRRFFAALDKVLVRDADQINYVDMRYTNGFAVGWKPSGRAKLANSRESRPHG